MEELVRYLKALTYLQLQSLAGAQTFGKPELLLSKAGFTHKEIASLLDKKESAVSMAIIRARDTKRESR